MKSAFDQRTLELLIDSAEWRALGLLFESPVEPWGDSLRGLAASIPNEQLRKAVVFASCQASLPDYYSLAGPGGPVPLREASYRQRLDLGQLLAEVEAFYEAFAFKPESHEPVDHLAVEVAFISYLRMKEAYARLSDAPEEAGVTRQAADDFVRDHLVYIAEPLHQAAQACGMEYLALAAAILRERVGAAPATLPVLGTFEPDDHSCEATNGC